MAGKRNLRFNRCMKFSLFFISLLLLYIVPVNAYDVSCDTRFCTIKSLTSFYNLNFIESRVQIQLELYIHSLSNDRSNTTIYLVPFEFYDTLKDFDAFYYEGNQAGYDYDTGFNIIRDNWETANISPYNSYDSHNPMGEVYTRHSYQINLSTNNDSIYTLILDFNINNLLSHEGMEYHLKHEIHNPSDTPNQKAVIVFPKDITKPKTNIDHYEEGHPPNDRWAYIFDSNSPITIVFESLAELDAYQNSIEWRGAIKGGLIGFFCSLLASWLLYLFIEKKRPTIDKNYFNRGIRSVLNKIDSLNTTANTTRRRTSDGTLNKKEAIYNLWLNHLNYKIKLARHHFYQGVLFLSAIFSFVIYHYIQFWFVLVIIGLVFVIFLMLTSQSYENYLYDMYFKLIKSIKEDSLLEYKLDSYKTTLCYASRYNEEGRINSGFL